MLSRDTPPTHLGLLLFRAGLAPSRFEPHRNNLRMIANPLHIKDPGRFCEIAQPGEAVVPGVEIWWLFGEMSTDSSEMSATIVIFRRGHRLLRLRFLRNEGLLPGSNCGDPALWCRASCYPVNLGHLLGEGQVSERRLLSGLCRVGFLVDDAEAF